MNVYQSTNLKCDRLHLQRLKCICVVCQKTQFSSNVDNIKHFVVQHSQHLSFIYLAW